MNPRLKQSKPSAIVACEFSGVVRSAFEAQGFDAWSCDLLPTEKTGKHYQGDIFDAMSPTGFFGERHFDLLIAHPDCTYLCSSGLHWNSRRPGRAQLTEEALQFVADIWSLPVHFKCLENPQGCISTRLSAMPKPQYIQPWQFGEDASKKTGLWLDNLPPLAPTKVVPGRIVVCNGKEAERWANQTDSGQNRIRPSSDRWKERARTYEGIAKAMARQWGGFIKKALTRP